MLLTVRLSLMHRVQENFQPFTCSVILFSYSALSFVSGCEVYVSCVLFSLGDEYSSIYPSLLSNLFFISTHSCLMSHYTIDSIIQLIISACSYGLCFFHSSAVCRIIAFISFALATARFLCMYILFNNSYILFSCRIIVNLSQFSIVKLCSSIVLS